MQTSKMKWFLLPFVGILLTTWIAVGLQNNRRVDQNALRNAGRTGEDWLTYGLNYGETRYSPLKQIDTTNVQRLGLAWTYEIGPGGGNQEATPLVSNGVLYSITNWSITFAVDARTGKELWKYDPQVDRAATQPKICCGVVNRGLAIYDGKIFIPVIDGRLVAVDATTGTLVWSVQTVPTDQPYSMTMAPRIAKNKVIVGNAGAEYPVRGFFSAYDTATGKLAWRFYTVPGDPAKGFENKAMEMAAKTWSGEWYKMGGGGTVWDAISYDPDTNLVFVGTGNGGPWPEELRQSKGLDNLFVASLIAVDADTGDYKWHYQFVPGDSWDYDSVQGFTFMDLRINGQNRKVITQANKGGFFYVIDRTNGKLISAEPFAGVNWASEIDLKTGRPMIRPEARYGSKPVTISPGPGGAHNWAPMSFNPTTGLIYLPATASSNITYTVAQNFTYNPAGMNMGAAFGGFGGFGAGGGRGGPAPPAPVGGIADPGAAINAGAAPAAPPAPPAALVLPMIGPRDEKGELYTGGWLIAWDPVTQKEKWRVQAGGGGAGGGGGTLTTAGNLVFHVLTNGRLMAYSADKGEKLLDLAIGQNNGMGPPITYMIDGKQYISVAGGSGARGGFGRGGPGGPGPGPGGPGAPGAPPAGRGAPPAGAAPPPPAFPAGPPAPTTPPVNPRLYTYVLDGNAPNPTPPPPAAPAAPPRGGQ